MKKKVLILALIVAGPLLAAWWLSRGKRRSRHRIIEEAQETQASFRSA